MTLKLWPSPIDVSSARTKQFLTPLLSFQSFFVLDDFEQKFTSVDINKLLSDSRIRKDMNCAWYLIKMRKLLIKIHSWKSFCQYVMHEFTTLYGCDSVRELKQKFLIFEIIDKTCNNSSQTNYYFSRCSFDPTKSGLELPPAVVKRWHTFRSRLHGCSSKTKENRLSSGLWQ